MHNSRTESTVCILERGKKVEREGGGGLRRMEIQLPLTASPLLHSFLMQINGIIKKILNPRQKRFPN